jgi:tetratricopeptide (TPR) repeat protein
MAHEHDMYMHLADVAMELRDEPALSKYAALLEELAARDDHKLYIATAHRAHGVALRLAGSHAQAEVRLKQALDLFNEMGARWQIGRTFFELAELNLAQSRKKNKAREYFSQALRVFGEIHAIPDVERTRARLISPS